MGKKRVTFLKKTWISKAAHDYKPPCNCKSFGIPSNEFSRDKKTTAWINTILGASSMSLTSSCGGAAGLL